MPIADFFVKFEHLYNKAKVHKMELQMVHWLMNF